MIERLFCGRFRRLSSERHDRVLNEREASFVTLHRETCRPCAEAELQRAIALNMLRESALEASPHPSFDERLIRKFRLCRSRDSFRYWSPAFAGAVIAGITVLAAMQVVTQSVDSPRSFGERTGAYRLGEPGRASYPTLILERAPVEASTPE